MSAPSDKDPVQAPATSASGKRRRLNAGHVGLTIIITIAVIAFCVYAFIAIYGLTKAG